MTAGIPDAGIRRIAQANREGMSFLADPPVPQSEKYKGIIEYPGFHTTDSFQIAATYTMGRVVSSFTKTDENGVSYVTDYPVVVSLLMEGFSPQVDYDAKEMVWEVLQIHLDEFIDSENITEDSTDEEISNAMYDFVETIDYTQERIPEEPWEFVAEESFMHFENPLGSLREDPAMPEAVRNYIRIGDFPDDLLMKATEQYRYTEDVSEERLVAVYFLTPLAGEASTWESEDDEELEARWPGFDIASEDDLMSGYYSFEEHLVWGGVGAGEQLMIPGIEPGRGLEYHGTTYLRLLQAAPFLADELPSPPSPPYREVAE